jgi:hypothetical protein
MDLFDLDAGSYMVTDEEIPTFTHEVEATKINGKIVCTITDEMREHEDVYDRLLSGEKHNFDIRVFGFINKRNRLIHMGLFLIVKIRDNEFRYNIKIPDKMIEFIINCPVLLIITKTKRPVFVFPLEGIKEEIFECYQQTLIRKEIFDLIDESEEE